MRHKLFGKHLGRNVGQRNALRRTLITQFFLHERITTTRAKAEAIRGAAEHMITQAKRAIALDDPQRIIHVRRLLNGRLDDPEMSKKAFEVFAIRYAERPGGYTRMFKIGPRRGDAAEMVVLELVDRDKEADTSENKGVTGTARSLLDRVRRPRRTQTTAE
ncbi:MAG: 50S ribosomal protein L17 [Chloroflexota bacterium]